MPFDFAQARTNMVDGQIRPNKVTTPRLLDALQDIPRENFVPPALQSLAYSEQELALPQGRFLLAPMVLARMIEALELTPMQRVLDIAPVTGYSTAILASLAQSVVGLEADNGFAANAGQMLAAQNVKNAQILHGPISMGAKQFAPYDAVFVNGAMAEVPKTLFHQLVEGGKLIAIVGGEPGATLGRVTLFTKFHGTVSERVLFEAAASYIPGFTAAEVFAL